MTTPPPHVKEDDRMVPEVVGVASPTPGMPGKDTTDLVWPTVSLADKAGQISSLDGRHLVDNAAANEDSREMLLSGDDGVIGRKECVDVESIDDRETCSDDKDEDVATGQQDPRLDRGTVSKAYFLQRVPQNMPTWFSKISHLNDIQG